MHFRSPPRDAGVSRARKSEVEGRYAPIRDMHTPRRDVVESSSGYFEQYYGGTVAAASSHRRAMETWSRGVVTHVGAALVRRELVAGRLRYGANLDSARGMRAESTRDECESNQPAAPPMAIPASSRLIVLAAGLQVTRHSLFSGDDEQPAIAALSNFGNSHEGDTARVLFRLAFPWTTSALDCRAPDRSTSRKNVVVSSDGNCPTMFG